MKTMWPLSLIGEHLSYKQKTAERNRPGLPKINFIGQRAKSLQSCPAMGYATRYEWKIHKLALLRLPEGYKTLSSDEIQSLYDRAVHEVLTEKFRG